MSAKALSLANDIRDDLARRFTTVSAVSYAADGNAYVLVGAGTTGTQSVYVKILDVALTSGIVNVIGSAQANYGNPVVIQLVVEPSANAGLIAGPTLATMIGVIGTVAHRGTRIETYTTALTNTGVASAASETAIAAGTNKTTFDPDFKNRLQSQI